MAKIQTIQDIISKGLKEYDMKKPYREFTKQLEDQRGKASQDGSAHYKQMQIEPWDVIDCWSFEQQVGYHRGNILKYTMRMGSKDERIKEAKKIRHYAEKLIEVLEKKYGTNS
jgi:GTP-sensing pleiotropic transcriptional regulator CodY